MAIVEYGKAGGGGGYSISDRGVGVMQCVMLQRYKPTPFPPTPHPSVWGIPLNFFLAFSQVDNC